VSIPVAHAVEPHPALWPYVHAYVEQRLALPRGQALHVIQCAHTDPVACVTWGSGEVRIGMGEGFTIPPLALAGPLPRSFTNTFRGTVQGFFVRFTPVGPLALLGVAGRRYAASPRLEDLVEPDLAPAVRAWADGVIEARDVAARAALTDRLLLGRLPWVPARIALMQRAVARIEAASGRLRIDALARALGVGASTLRRRFRGELGIPAKLFSEIVRFRHTHAFLHTTPEARWADAALRFGYADQSHLIRDYQRFAGVSPTQWSPELRHLDLNFGILEDAPPLGPATAAAGR